MPSSHPLQAVLPTFRAVVRTTVPHAASLDDEAWRRGEETVTWALASRPARVVRQINLFLRVLDLVALVRHGTRFRRLPDGSALQLLGALERSRSLLLRRGVWGVRTLAFMAVYAQPEVATRVGYRADAVGWAAHQGGAPWPERAGTASPEPEVTGMLRRASARAGRDSGGDEPGDA